MSFGLSVAVFFWHPAKGLPKVTSLRLASYIYPTQEISSDILCPGFINEDI